MDPNRLSDSQRSIMAARSSEPWWCWTSTTRQSPGYPTRALLTSTSSSRWSAHSFTGLRNLPRAVTWLCHAASALTALRFKSHSSNFPTRHITRWSIEVRRRWCHRPEMARANFGTSSGPVSSLVLLSTSLPADWPQFRATTRADFLRLMEFVMIFKQGAAAGVGHRIADFRQELTLDGRLASGPRNQRYHQMGCMIERSLRFHGHETQGQLHHHPGASVREKGSLGRMSVGVLIIMKEANSLVRVIQLWRCPLDREDKTWSQTQRSDAWLKSNVNIFERPLQSASSSKRLTSRRKTILSISNSIQDRTYFENFNIFFAKELRICEQATGPFLRKSQNTVSIHPMVLKPLLFQYCFADWKILFFTLTGLAILRTFTSSKRIQNRNTRLQQRPAWYGKRTAVFSLVGQVPLYACAVASVLWESCHVTRSPSWALAQTDC